MKRGITLIQLIFLIACLCLLAAVSYKTIITTRQKAADTANRVAAERVQRAINNYILDHGVPPQNFGPRGIPAFEHGLPDASGKANAYERSMSQLVPQYLSSIPHSQGGNFAYYDYGPGTSMGAMFINEVTTEPDSSSGYAPSCRPFYEKKMKQETATSPCITTVSCYKTIGDQSEELCVPIRTSCKAAVAHGNESQASASATPGQPNATTGSSTGRGVGKKVGSLTPLTTSNWCTNGISSSDDCYCSPYGS